MGSTTQSDGADANNVEEKVYPNINGEPLTCPECGHCVVVVYRSGHKCGAYNAGFYQCDCAFGGKVGGNVTEDFWGVWIADRVDDNILNFYLHDELAENWRGDDDE